MITSNSWAFYVIFLEHIYFPIKSSPVSFTIDDLESVATRARITKFHITSAIRSRFAATNVLSSVENLESVSREVTFRAALPNSAFITNFTMQTGGRIYAGVVKEREQARQTYDKAKSRCETAALAAQSLPDTNVFEMSANVETYGTATFDLSYEEILTRVEGVYKHVLNVNPGQLVDDMKISVSIAEKYEILMLKVPKVQERLGQKTNGELLSLSDMSGVSIERQTSPELSTATISYSPTREEQVQALGHSNSGQFVVLYDVKRDHSSGQIEVVDGYFVHFFAPTSLKTGSKRVVFVLDRSGSMGGVKLAQLKAAMKIILSEVNPSDSFNIVIFDHEVETWQQGMVSADADHVHQAQIFIDSITARGSTDIKGAYQKGIELLSSDSSLGLVSSESPIISMLIFLTDGLPTAGENRSEKIVEAVKGWNSRGTIRLHNIGFGEDVDYELLKKISIQNKGIARKVFEDSESDLQLRGFYNEVSSPLLSDVSINYVNETIEPESIVLSREFDYFEGGEMVVAGAISDDLGDHEMLGGTAITGGITGNSISGREIFPIDHAVPCSAVCKRCPSPIEPDDIGGSNICDDCWRPRRCLCEPLCPVEPPPIPVVPFHSSSPLPPTSVGGYVERMWAYLTIKKLLDEQKYKESDPTKQQSLKARALDLSLKYNFVTELTSIVITKEGDRDYENERLISTSAEKSGDDAKKTEAGTTESNSPRRSGTKDEDIGGASSRSGLSDTGHSSISSVLPGGVPSSTGGEANDSSRSGNFAAPVGSSPAKTGISTGTSDDGSSEMQTAPTTPNESEGGGGPDDSGGTKTVGTCSFMTIPAASVGYDKGRIVTSLSQLNDARSCAATCASQPSCQFAVWLPNGLDCLIVGQENLVDCSIPEETVDGSVVTVLYCIQCEV